MTTETKKETNYVGKGKAFGVDDRNIRISLRWADLLKLTKNEYKDVKTIQLVVVPLKDKSEYGHTHTVIEHVHVPKEN
jgi:hypothetical protein